MEELLGNEPRWIYNRLLDTTRTLQILSMGQPQKEEKIDRYNILRKGKVIFWNVSESEMFERLEDYAVEQYVTGEKIEEQLTYEPIKEED